MDRSTSTVANFALNFLIGYGVGALLRGRRAGLGVGFVAGTVGALASWVAYGRFEDVDELDDDAELVEIEV
jgi:multisubunit Na+/H+ antiporter MnhB subunit